MSVTNSPTLLVVVFSVPCKPVVVLLTVVCWIVSNVSVLVVSVSVTEVSLVSCSSVITSSEVDCNGTILLSSSNKVNVPDAASMSIWTGCKGALTVSVLLK